MKKTLTLLIIMLFTLSVFGQHGSQYLRLTGGFAVPFKDLANNNLQDSASGFASYGAHAAVSYDYQLTHNFGLGLQAFYYESRFSERKFANYYAEILGDAINSVEPGNGWSTGGILLRPYLTLPLSDKFSIDLYGSAGFIGVYSPSYTLRRQSIIPPGPNPVHSYFRARSKAFSFAYGMGSRFNFNIATHDFFISAEYLLSRINYKEVTGLGWDEKPYQMTITQNLGYLSINLGYSYTF